MNDNTCFKCGLDLSDKACFHVYNSYGDLSYRCDKCYEKSINYGLKEVYEKYKNYDQVTKILNAVKINEELWEAIKEHLE